MTSTKEGKTDIQEKSLYATESKLIINSNEVVVECTWNPQCNQCKTVWRIQKGKQKEKTMNQREMLTKCRTRQGWWKNKINVYMIYRYIDIKLSTYTYTWRERENKMAQWKQILLQLIT